MMNKQKFLVLKAAIERETKNIDRIESRLQRYRRMLSDLEVQEKQNGALDLSDACILVGAALDDYYLAVENIFKVVATELDGGLPAGEHWHRQLLTNMMLEVPGIRPPLLSEDTVFQLDEFRRFRHLFRNIYGFALDANRVADLAARVPDITKHLKQEINSFLATMQAIYSISDESYHPKQGPRL